MPEEEAEVARMLKELMLCVQVGMGGAAVCYSYSCSKGVFAGVSIEGSLLTTRNDVNLNFYGTSPFSGSRLLQRLLLMAAFDSVMQSA